DPCIRAARVADTASRRLTPTERRTGHTSAVRCDYPLRRQRGPEYVARRRARSASATVACCLSATAFAYFRSFIPNPCPDAAAGAFAGAAEEDTIPFGPGMPC